MHPDEGFGERLGLNIPYEWWPTVPLLKEIEASGFAWVQLPSPPTSVLGNLRNCLEHAAATARNLSSTSLRTVLHGPTDLLLGTSESDGLFEGVMSYAAECGASQVIYHARAIPDEPESEPRLQAEARSLARAATCAERLGLIIAIENLAPVFPGPQAASSIPHALRALKLWVGSEAIKLCLDIGHANIVAGLRRTSLERLTDPVMDAVSLFHLHDNLGARRAAEVRSDLDPLRLDLHLPPGRGAIAWERIAPALTQHDAPLLLEVHHPHRPPPAELFAGTWELLAPPATTPPDRLTA